MNKRQITQIKEIALTGILMLIGILLLKILLMQIYGKNILFDASAHIIIASFLLYVGYCFIDENKSWRIPYFIFSLFVLVIISIQRILVHAYNDIGLLLGLPVSITSILIPKYNKIKNKFKF